MKYMNMKRFASVVMAGALAVSVMAPAFAEDKSTVITATYAETELDVTVPATAAATINPYGLPVTMEDAVTTISNQPITIATPLMIENKSSVALKVGANVKAEVTGLALAAAETGVAAGTAKEAYVELQLFEAAGVDGATSADPTTTNPKYAALKDADAVLKAVLATGAAGVDASGSKDLVLRAGADGLAQDGGVAFVRLSGVAAKKPTTAWATTDKLVATITYSFEPSTYVEEGKPLAAVATTLDGTSTTTTTVTVALPSADVTLDGAVTWSSSKAAAIKIEQLAGDGNELKGTATWVAEDADPVTITATYKCSDGNTYKSTIDLTAGAA